MSESAGMPPRSRKLTSRQADIIRILLETGRQPVTVREVAKQLGFSSRTVLRELPAIERWFREHEIHFVRKPSVGLSIQEEHDTIQLLQSLLGRERILPAYTRQDRRRQILGELLFAREPMKSLIFLNRFQISEGTLSSDLDALEQWLSPYQIRMIRRPGLGIFLEGSETAYRKAIAAAAFEFLEEGDILALLRGTGHTAPALPLPDNSLFHFIEPEIVSFIERLLQDTEQEFGIQYSDSGYMALAVHLSLAIHRLQTGEQIELDPDELAQLSVFPEFHIARQIISRISQQFHLDIPDAEAGFITMHLRNARRWNSQNRGQSQAVNTGQLIADVIQSMEQQLELPFHTSIRLQEDLVSHIDALVKRLSLGEPLDTMQNATQTELLRQKYPEIYRAVEQAKPLFLTRLGINSFPPSEITFIAMHFAAAAELLRAEQRRVAVAVVCPSGMGASRMLAANLMRSCPEVDVRQVASAFHITPEQLRRDGIDLVISTVPLQIDFPSVCVKPIPQAQDMLRLTQAIESISKKRQTHPDTPDSALCLSRQKIDALTRLGLETAELLDHFIIWDLPALSHTEDLIGCAAGLYADSIAARQRISADLARREAIQSTFLADMHIYLLHCQTAAVQHCRFGYLRLLQPIILSDETHTNNNTIVEGAVLLLAPVGDRQDTQEAIHVISRISMLLVEEKRFLEALKRGDEKEGSLLAEQALVKYYESELQRKKGKL